MDLQGHPYGCPLEIVRDAFIRVLSAGGSDYAHNILLNEAGLDMT